MLLDAGILLGLYVGVKYLRKKTNPSDKKPLKKTTTAVSNQQSISKKSRHYLLLSLAAIPFAYFGSSSWLLHLIASLVISLAVLPILQNAETAFRKEGKIGHNMLISIMSFLVFLTGQLLALAIGIVFYHISQNVLEKTKADSKQVLTNLFEQQPETVWIFTQGNEVEVPLSLVQKDDIVVVNTGEVVPVDGEIVDGFARIDQHSLTGEFQAYEKSIGDQVFASTLVLSGQIYIRVEHTGSDTSIAKIGEILKHTADFKSSLQTQGEIWADKIALPLLALGVVSSPIIGIIGTTALLNSSFGNRVTLTLPLSVLNHLSHAAHHGILVKDGRSLETFVNVDTVLFDKTGTLTEDYPEIGSIIVFDDNYAEKDIIFLAALAEGKLTHPIAKAIQNKAKQHQIDLSQTIDNADYEIGFGITVTWENQVVQVGGRRFMSLKHIAISDEVDAKEQIAHEQGHSYIMVAVDNQIKGAIELQPVIRTEVTQTIAGLRERGIKHIAIVSGDAEQPTRKLAAQLNIENCFYNVLPENKAEIVQSLQKEGKTVCFVGDGVNDVVAIKSANVSVSLKGASSIATDSAQVILMDTNLFKLCELMDIAKQLQHNNQKTLTILSVPVMLDIAGSFLFKFGMMQTVIINQTGLLVALWNVMKTREITQDDKN